MQDQTTSIVGCLCIYLSKRLSSTGCPSSVGSSSVHTYRCLSVSSRLVKRRCASSAAGNSQSPLEHLIAVPGSTTCQASATADFRLDSSAIHYLYRASGTARQLVIPMQNSSHSKPHACEQWSGLLEALPMCIGTHALKQAKASCMSTASSACKAQLLLTAPLRLYVDVGFDGQPGGDKPLSTEPRLQPAKPRLL